MSSRDRQNRLQQPRDRRARPERQQAVKRVRILAFGSLALVVAMIATIVFASGSQLRGSRSAKGSPSTGSLSASNQPGNASVPILVYHVINVPPPQSEASPELYVSADEFSSQMVALKDGGWHAVTLDQLEAYWTRGVPLGPGKPFVITFDGGYESQYTNALPVLERLAWVGVEDLPASGLSPTQGGLTDAQVRAMIAAGWELDTEGMTDADLVAAGSDELPYEVVTARRLLRSRYDVPVNWFSYPSGDYDAVVIDAVRSAGFVGSTTTISGWASPQQDRFRLPRLQVLAAISPSQLLSQIASAQASTAIPSAHSGAESP